MAMNMNLFHPEEEKRVQTLHDLQILDTPIEQRFEQLTELLRSIFRVPMSALSFVDVNRQWFKSIQGQRVEQTRRCVSFCQHTILQSDVLVIPDARFDDRFDSSPLVTEDPGIVFYAGAPVYGPSGLPVASLCILDRQPRSLDDREIKILTQLARVTETLLNSPRASEVEDQLINQVGESWRATLVDPLTRVWNADGITTLIKETVARSKATNDSIGVGMIEITGLDQFKQDFGGAAADEIVLEFSRRALAVMKPHDSIGHLRGGEFGILNIKLVHKDGLLDRLGILQMIADELSQSLRYEGHQIGARVCSMLLNPNTTTTGKQAVMLVEESLTQMPKNECSMPQVVDDPNTSDQSCAA
jgi:GGDEF domain-containing protein